MKDQGSKSTGPLPRSLQMRIGVAVAFVALAAAGGFWAWRAHEADPKVQAAHLAANDRTLLKHATPADAGNRLATPTAPELYAALIRRSSVAESLALEAALRLRVDPRMQVREGCALALGHFPTDPRTRKALEEMLQDHSAQVRSDAVRALAGLPGSTVGSSDAALSEWRGRSDVGPAERVGYYAGILRANPANSTNLTKLAVRSAAIRELDELARSRDGHGDELTVLQLLAAQAPSDPATLQILTNILKPGHSAEATTLAIRHLAAVGDANLGPQMSRLGSRSSLPVRLAVIQSLHQACPLDRITLLRTILIHETDLGALDSALGELSLMPSPAMLQMLQNIEGARKWTPPQFASLHDAIRNLQRPHLFDPCREQDVKRKPKI